MNSGKPVPDSTKYKTESDTSDDDEEKDLKISNSNNESDIIYGDEAITWTNSITGPSCLNTWDPQVMVNDDGTITCAIAVIGQRGTGKSHATNYLLSLIGKHFDEVLVITGTRFNGYWQEKLYSACVISDEFLEIALVDLLERQKRAELLRRMGKRSTPLNTVIILDDWIHDVKHARYSETVNKLFTAGRHYKICVICLSQYATAISTYVRSNVDYVLLLRINMEKQKEAVCNDHLDVIPNKHITKQMLVHCTMDRNILVVNKSPIWNSLSEVFLTWRAEAEVKPYKIGNPEWNKKMIADSKKMDKEEFEEVTRAKPTVDRNVVLNMYKLCNEIPYSGLFLK